MHLDLGDVRLQEREQNLLKVFTFSLFFIFWSIFSIEARQGLQIFWVSRVQGVFCRGKQCSVVRL